MFNFDKRFGFTLAEVLITIGVLGSIAAITIPTLAYNYRGKVLEQQFRATYSDIKSVATVLNDLHGGDWATYVNGSGYGTWYSEFMSKFNGGNSYRSNATHQDEAIYSELRALYGVRGNAGSGRYLFNIQSGLQNMSEVCDNGGLWADSKGRIWSFNAENGMVCVDVNGTAKPNRVNVDVFGFIPMSPAQLATFVYNDAANPNNYTGTIVPCNLELIIRYGKANIVPIPQYDSYKDEDKKDHWVKFEKGSGSALDYCPFFEPVENRAVLKDDYCATPAYGCGKSARGRDMTASNNYWKDYIEYK
ncbi:MAG: type II secretion system GspH family protein [Muribaculaceae bacterium]|nr:type II secretion system GspH family protein [Muribaculaceae bacterium]